MAAKRSTADDTVYVKLDEARAFIRRCLQSVGTKTEHALQHANVLVAADYRGHYSHGINRLGKATTTTSTDWVRLPARRQQTTATASTDYSHG